MNVIPYDTCGRSPFYRLSISVLLLYSINFVSYFILTLLMHIIITFVLLHFVTFHAVVMHLVSFIFYK